MSIPTRDECLSSRVLLVLTLLLCIGREVWQSVRVTKDTNDVSVLEARIISLERRAVVAEPKSSVEQQQSTGDAQGKQPAASLSAPTPFLNVRPSSSSSSAFLHNHDECGDISSNNLLGVVPLHPRWSNKSAIQPWKDLLCGNNRDPKNKNKRSPQIQHEDRLNDYHDNNIDFVYGSHRYWDLKNQSLGKEFYELKNALAERRRNATKENNKECPMRVSSLEILAEIIQDMKEKEKDNTRDESCLRPDTQSTWNLLASRKTKSFGLPILNLGFPKSGSTTLANFFRCAGGYRVGNEQQGVCMNEAINKGCPPVSACGHPSSQVYMQMDFTYPRKAGCYYPQVQFLDEIHAEYPNATFVMAIRPVKTWIRSATNFNEMALRWRFCKIPGLYRRNSSEGLQAYDIEQWACSHYRHVRKFVQMNPSHTLIEVDLYNRTETSYLLSQLFDAPPTCWGHSNSNNKTASK